MQGLPRLVLVLKSSFFRFDCFELEFIYGFTRVNHQSFATMR